MIWLQKRIKKFLQRSQRFCSVAVPVLSPFRSMAFSSPYCVLNRLVQKVFFFEILVFLVKKDSQCHEFDLTWICALPLILVLNCPYGLHPFLSVICYTLKDAGRFRTPWDGMMWIYLLKCGFMWRWWNSQLN